MLLLLFLLTFSGVPLPQVAAQPGAIVNPVSIPIIQDAMDVQTARFAKLPDYNGIPSRILTIVPFKRKLYVGTHEQIFQISRRKKVTLFFDLPSAMMATGRLLNTRSPFHGGVRGMAFHPKFRKNRLFYTSLMEKRPKGAGDFNYLSDGDNPVSADGVVVEWKVDKVTGKPDPTSYRQVVRIGMNVFDHTIREIVFRGKFLYISHGDGSIQSATAGGGQRNDALGKILKINPLQDGSNPYSVPRSNPFLGNSSMLDEVYALGFRNPHQICFGKDGTLYSTEVGRSNVDEVNIVKKGLNYGWSLREGTFVMLGAGIVTGVAPLPADDDGQIFEYPAAQVGHEGTLGNEKFTGQALAGACPVENGSPMSGNYFYVSFPRTGALYFSTIEELKNAKTNGPPSQLTQARTRQAKIFFDHDDDPSTAPLPFDTLGDIVRFELGSGFKNARADIRMGGGKKGELYWSSKTNGQVYIFTSSLPGATSLKTPSPSPSPLEDPPIPTLESA